MQEQALLLHRVCTAVQDLTCVSHHFQVLTMSASNHLLCLITTWTSVSAELLHLDHDTELGSKVSI